MINQTLHYIKEDHQIKPAPSCSSEKIYSMGSILKSMEYMSLSSGTKQYKPAGNFPYISESSLSIPKAPSTPINLA